MVPKSIFLRIRLRTYAPDRNPPDVWVTLEFPLPEGRCTHMEIRPWARAALVAQIESTPGATSGEYYAYSPTDTYGRVDEDGSWSHEGWGPGQVF